MIRGGVYRIDLGLARGQEQRGKRLGLVVSPSDSPLPVVTVIPHLPRLGWPATGPNWRSPVGRHGCWSTRSARSTSTMSWATRLPI